VKLRVLIIATLGLCLAVYLVAYVGLGRVVSAAVAVGWSGFAALCVYLLALFMVLGAAWHALLPGSHRPRMRVLTWARMVRDSASEVLPFSQLGGMVLGARAAVLHGLAPALAFASLVVDVTTEMLAQIGFTAVGLAILIARAPKTSFAASLTKVVAIGLVLAIAGGMLFLALQRYGHRLTGKVAAHLLPRAVASTTALRDAFDAIYDSPARVALSTSIHFAAWFAAAVATWIVFRLIGARIDLTAVIAIESMVYAARSAAVLVPNALGVQEATYALLAPLFGVGAQYGLAVSLLKRARDIAVGVPILLIWQGVESRRALAAAAGEDIRSVSE
jgi:putative membrane protein